ncbi:hypothetical protein M8C21_020116 [Ambrosia artemisiifolia]|uniref:Uncharacterized protein n=1 Tax=Ambrosia artemisiifolia TaxID=4212 RepID=A0AAD5GFX5_AMBAR|nr:hypothetical protein M8C21_020116 [Ambrosia artemisiifolia]
MHMSLHYCLMTLRIVMVMMCVHFMLLLRGGEALPKFKFPVIQRGLARKIQLDLSLFQVDSILIKDLMHKA